MSEIDDKGQVLTQFTDVKSPQHLSTTTDDDVFVADRANHRILLLNSQLQLESVPIDTNSQEVKPWYPFRLHYNELTSQLYFVHSSSSVWGPPFYDVLSHWILR